MATRCSLSKRSTNGLVFGNRTMHPPEGHELEILGSESECSYLPAERSRMQFRLALSLTTQRYEHLLERGWRRFGRTLFRPICRQCSECQSLRVNIADFRPGKSQRRARNRNASVRLVVQKPTLTDEHLELYNLYHQDMHERRGWPFREVCEDQYFESFIDGEFEFSREFQYRLNDELVGLGIVDMTGTVMSSIYFIHHPRLRPASPGTMSVLREIEVGQNTGHRWLYMGYYIQDCGSMNYKNRFTPHELLENYVDDETAPTWSPPAGSAPRQS